MIWFVLCVFQLEFLSTFGRTLFLDCLFEGCVFAIWVLSEFIVGFFYTFIHVVFCSGSLSSGTAVVKSYYKHWDFCWGIISCCAESGEVVIFPIYELKIVLLSINFLKVLVHLLVTKATTHFYQKLWKVYYNLDKRSKRLVTQKKLQVCSAVGSLIATESSTCLVADLKEWMDYNKKTDLSKI